MVLSYTGTQLCWGTRGQLILSCLLRDRNLVVIFFHRLAFFLQFFTSSLCTVCQITYPVQILRTWGGFKYCVVRWANGPCATSCIYAYMSLAVTVSAISKWAVLSMFVSTWWTLSSIAFACGFFIVVGLRLRPYESHRSSKFSLNLLPLSRYGNGGIYTTTCCIRRDIRSDVLSKIYSLT